MGNGQVVVTLLLDQRQEIGVLEGGLVSGGHFDQTDHRRPVLSWSPMDFESDLAMLHKVS